VIYVYACPDCDDITEEFRKLEDRNNLPECSLCKVEMQRVIGGHAVVPDLQPYFDDNLQCGIRSKQHRHQVMREQGVYEKFGENWHTGKSNKSKRH